MFLKSIYLLLVLTFFTATVNISAQEISYKNKTNIICGDEQLNAYLPLLQHKRVGVLINQSARVGNRLLVDTLLSLKVNVVKIFVPEHGLRGTADAGAKVNSGKDQETGLPVVSLYGHNKKPTDEQLSDLDIVIYDLQDVGLWFYTYISTLQYMMEACAENGKELLILDRPDPNGFYVDGPVLDTSLRSFVGMQPIPVVYGMTVGEYARMIKGEHWFIGAGKLKMKVITCKNYYHDSKYDLKYPPSPNLRSMTAIYLYPSLCFFEGTPVSVGRGTDHPFEQWGHPDFKDNATYTFTPHSMEGATHPPYENKVCWGERVAQNKQQALAIINGHLQLKWLLTAYTWYPDKSHFFTNFFQYLVGNKQLKQQIEEGMTEKQIRETWQPDLEKFKQIRKKYLLYKDFE